ASTLTTSRSQTGGLDSCAYPKRRANARQTPDEVSRAFCMLRNERGVTPCQAGYRRLIASWQAIVLREGRHTRLSALEHLLRKWCVPYGFGGLEGGATHQTSCQFDPSC